MQKSKRRKSEWKQLEFEFVKEFKALNTYKQRVGALKLETVTKFKKLFAQHLFTGLGQEYEQQPKKLQSLITNFLKEKNIHELLFKLRFKPEHVQLFNHNSFDEDFHPVTYEGREDYPYHEFLILSYFRDRKGSPSKTKKLLLQEFETYLRTKTGQR